MFFLWYFVSNPGGDVTATFTPFQAFCIDHVSALLAPCIHYTSAYHLEFYREDQVIEIMNVPVMSKEATINFNQK